MTIPLPLEGLFGPPAAASVGDQCCPGYDDAGVLVHSDDCHLYLAALGDLDRQRTAIRHKSGYRDLLVPPGALVLEIRGLPTTQGSKKPRPIWRGTGADREFTGHVALEEATGEKLRQWRQDVRDVAVMHSGRFPKGVGVIVVSHFSLPKPKSAPAYQTRPVTKPDADKLQRAVLDALTTASVYHDDGQVVDQRSTKSYPGQGEGPRYPGAYIVISPDVPCRV